jgi:LuxR family maltose regulon positive regulatory protein
LERLSFIMTDPRIISKTTLPDPARTITRPRLIRRITEAGSARVILITGQAAQGKSTLAAQIARLPGPDGAWVHLDPTDSDPVNFFHLLVHALKAVQPTLDVSVFLKNPSIALGPDVGSGRMVDRVGTLMETVTLRSPVRLVIDGLETLGDNAGTLTLIEAVRDLLFPPSCLMLVSREMPMLKLETLRMRQELLVLDNDDLAFTEDEIVRFYRDLFGLGLAPAQAARIRQITDGWAGGLILIWEVLSHVADNQRIPFIDDGLPAAMQSERLAYFSEVVFSGLDEATRHFLIRSAIFETIDPSLIERYMAAEPVGDVEVILNAMVRQNRFIHPFYDPSTGWGYRYNQLFRDFLLDKFHSTLDRQTQQALLARAADLAWDEANYEGAIRFFLQAEHFDKAAAGIKKIAMGLSAQARFADLSGWIGVLPDAMVRGDAWLSFYQTMGQRISGGRRNISAFSKALDRFAAEGDQRGQLMALAYLIETAVFIGHPAASLKAWLEAADALLGRVSGNRYYAFAKAVLWMQVAFGYISGAGDLHKGLSACRNAMLLAGTIRDDILTVNATIVHVFGLTLSGEFAAAQKALATIRHMVAAAYPEYRALRNIVRMKLVLSQGDLEQAQRLLDANQEHIDRFGLLFLYPIHVDLSGLLQIHQQRFDAAGRTSRHLTDVATLAANPFYHGLALRLRALKAYHQGRFERAHAWAGQAIAEIAQSLGKESIHLYRCRLILGMVAYHMNDLPAARQALESACDFFEQVTSHLSLVEARLGLSMVAAAMGDAAVADRHRESALEMAAAKGYRAFSLLSVRDIVAACTPAIEHTGRETGRLARRLVDRLQTDMPVAASQDSDETGYPAVAGELSSPRALDIRTLGGFEVHRDSGEIISDTQWSGSRQKLLLKAIVVNGCREIPKDILMDALWPESGYDAALKRFKVTLHRLRRILEPNEDQRTGASCILLKDNLVSLDMARCRVDVNDFLTACDTVRQLRGEDDDQPCLAACRHAIDLYRGDFLPEEPYLSWAEMKRAALKDQYIALLMETVEILERLGDSTRAARHCTALIQADPLAEQAHQKLMRLFMHQGQRNAAIKVYRDLELKLASELDTIPDTATTRIYEEIIDQRE